MHDDRIDLDGIDIRTVPPEQWDAILRQAARRAHVERSKACRNLAGRAWRGAWAWVRRHLSAGGPAGYPG